MSKLIVLQGLPGAGKSTWAKEWVNESPTTRIRVNRDDIRRMLGPYWIPQREDLVTLIETSMIELAMQNGYDVVIDATNFKYAKWQFIATAGKYEFELKVMDTPIDECIKRDSKRGDQSVGKDVIIGMYNKYFKDEKKS